MYLLLGVPYLWLSAVLAGATYIGFRFLMAPREEQNKEGEAVDTINEISQSGQKLPTPDLRQQALAISIKARTLLNQLESNKDASEAKFLIQQYLDQTCQGLRLFLADKSRNPAARSESLKVLGNLLATVTERFDNLQVSLDTQDDKALAGELKLLTQTLTDLDQFSTTLKQGNT